MLLLPGSQRLPCPSITYPVAVHCVTPAAVAACADSCPAGPICAGVWQHTGVLLCAQGPVLVLVRLLLLLQYPVSVP